MARESINQNSRFGRSRVRYLGHLLGQEGLRPDPEQIEPILEYQAPKTKRQIRHFLRRYSGFIKKESEIIAVMYGQSRSCGHTWRIIDFEPSRSIARYDGCRFLENHCDDWLGRSSSSSNEMSESNTEKAPFIEFLIYCED